LVDHDLTTGVQVDLRLHWSHVGRLFSHEQALMPNGSLHLTVHSILKKNIPEFLFLALIFQIREFFISLQLQKQILINNYVMASNSCQNKFIFVFADFTIAVN
jgi:hypothetical protein